VIRELPPDWPARSGSPPPDRLAGFGGQRDGPSAGAPSAGGPASYRLGCAAQQRGRPPAGSAAAASTANTPALGRTVLSLVRPAGPVTRIATATHSVTPSAPALSRLQAGSTTRRSHARLHRISGQSSRRPGTNLWPPETTQA